MFAELVHMCRHAPATLALVRELPQAELYATLIARADADGLAARRAELTAGLAGTIVEIGCGTGAMFPHYGGDVRRVIAAEPDAAFAAYARIAAAAARVPIEVIDASGDALPLADHSVDAAVIALVLCSVPSIDPVIREVVRVVRPGGAIRLIEHVRSRRPLVGALMHFADPVWRLLNRQNCHMDRDPIPHLERAGVRVERTDRFKIWSSAIPPFSMQFVVGSAPH